MRQPLAVPLAGPPQPVLVNLYDLGLSLYKGYSKYASEADQELFCRWKEIDIKGDNAKDGSTYRRDRERLANQQTP
jgi:hypothetical protein